MSGQGAGFEGRAVFTDKTFTGRKEEGRKGGSNREELP
jgi:hypothetical protein